MSCSITLTSPLSFSIVSLTFEGLTVLKTTIVSLTTTPFNQTFWFVICFVESPEITELKTTSRPH